MKPSQHRVHSRQPGKSRTLPKSGALAVVASGAIPLSFWLSNTHDCPLFNGMSSKKDEKHWQKPVPPGRALDAVIADDLTSLRPTHQPQYSPYGPFGMAKEGVGTHIGPKSFTSRAQLRNSIVHEELHHRWWERGIYDHHPKESTKEAKFYDIIRRYERMRGWTTE
jgi:hypothetical protein